jgi:hypothetical protein
MSNIAFVGFRFNIHVILPPSNTFINRANEKKIEDNSLNTKTSFAYF